MLLTKLEPKKTYRLKRKIYISYRYIKHYSPWVLLVLILLLVGTVIKKNYLNKPNKIKTSEVIIKKHYYRKPINDLAKTSDNKKLEVLTKQLLAEKEKNKELSSSLNNQEKQLVSALNDINESYISTFKNKPTFIAKEKVMASTSQVDYYNKVKAALNKNSTNKQNKKVLTSEKETIDPKAKKAEG